ncbi:hypothetical protein PhCBS80983_g03932 [Powellomyces hirtus]|uniref:Nucleolar protein 12 n=1 Tax=Powellomyces hirtus TaxID=109895 RepID=A0A507E034_9FUNG|nr:hypothetical protein PhCBS80983_g03932 [Powellomyces hirtus]
MAGIAQALFGSVPLDTDLDALFSSATAASSSASTSKATKAPSSKSETRKRKKDAVFEDVLAKTVKKTKTATEKAATSVKPSEDMAAEAAVAASPAKKKSKKSKTLTETADAVEEATKTTKPAKEALTAVASEPAAKTKKSKKAGKAAAVEMTAEAEATPTIAESVTKSKRSKKATKSATAEEETAEADATPADAEPVTKPKKGKKAAKSVEEAKPDTEESDDEEDDGVKIDIGGVEEDQGQSDSESDADSDSEAKPAADGKKTRRQVKEEIKEQNRRTIFIGNLPLKVTEKSHTKALKNLFAAHGPIASIRFRSIARNEKMPRRAAFITKNFHPGRDTLNAYLVYTAATSVPLATAAENGRLFLGNHIRVDKAAREKNEKHEYKRSVFVGALPFDISEEKVWEFFAQCGDVEGVRVVRDKATNVGKGIGYVLFKDKACVALAMKLHGSDLAGRKIRVNRCKDTSPEGKAKRLSETEGTRASRSDPVKGGVGKFRAPAAAPPHHRSPQSFVVARGTKRAPPAAGAAKSKYTPRTNGDAPRVKKPRHVPRVPKPQQ